MASSENQEHVHRICDVSIAQKGNMLPIYGYAKMPLVTLEKAVEPLVSIVPQLARMVQFVKDKCKNPPDNFSFDESASIMLYTLGKSSEDSFYGILNKTLRGGDRSALKHWFPYLKLVLTALSKIPSEKHYLHRGVKNDFSTDYPLGKSIVWWGFSSCTTSIGVLEESFLGQTGTRTLFEIDCHSGKDIRQHCFYKTEDEVLLLPARQFTVVGCLNPSNDLRIIKLKEIDSSPPLLEPLPMSDASTLVGPYRNPELEETIGKCSSRKVNLKGKQLNDQDMEIVSKQAIVEKKCITLDLTYNEVTERGVSILANALRNNIYLEELNISLNRISHSGVYYLASEVNSSVLKRVDLAQNDISDYGAAHLAEMLATNTNLLELSLRGNRIGDSGMKCLVDTLTHNNTCLESLNLSANRDISDESIDSMVNMMEHNQSLRKLDLRHSGLSKDGVQRLHDLAKSKRGFKLWLSHFI